MVWQPCLSPKVSSPGPKPGNGTTLVGLMRQTAQDAGVGRFEHILLCTDSMAEATVQTLPVRNCVVCSLSEAIVRSAPDGSDNYFLFDAL